MQHQSRTRYKRHATGWFNGVPTITFRSHLKKTELITFLRKHKTLQELKIKINNVEITPKPTVKYLGVIMDEKLSWRSHIETKMLQCKRKIMDLSRFPKLTWGANRDILTKLLTGIVDPMLLYAAPVWAEATKFGWCQKKLRSTQV